MRTVIHATIVSCVATLAWAQDRVNWQDESQSAQLFEQPGVTFAHALLEENPNLRASLETGSTYLQLREKLTQITVADRRYYVAEGDLLLDEDQLYFYAAHRDQQARDREMWQLTGGTLALDSYESQLTAASEGGRIVRWAEGLQLTYAFDRATFADDDEFARAVRYVTEATGDWEETCGVDFEQVTLAESGGGGDATPPLFIVRKFDSGGRFIASAFFPNDPVFRRRVLLDPSLFEPTLAFDPVGVLRHELGHVLGFRHEHIRSGAPAECPDENPGIELTEYDPQSVMHYFCGGVGSRTLDITQIDRRGAQAVYGQPRSRVRYFR